jgi:hypothetical protein
MHGGSVSTPVIQQQMSTYCFTYCIQVRLNGQVVDVSLMHKISNFVEQEDALLGVLTVKESIAYALRLQ